MADVHKKSYKAVQKNVSVFHPDLRQRISEVESLNKESLSNGRGVFDKVFASPTSENVTGFRKGTLMFSFTRSGHQTEYITVLEQNSVALNIKCKSVNDRKDCKKQRKLFDCSECDFNCWWDYIMVRHVRKVHSKGNLYVCVYCGFYCVHKYYYDLHVLENHRKSLAVYQCDKCDFVASKKGILRQHKVKHKDGKVPPSHMRALSEITQNLSNKQKKIDGLEKPYVCLYCDYRTKRKAHLITHELIHTGEKPFSCTFCNYRTRNKSHLVSHELIHTGEKPFSCTFCNYRTRNKSHLVYHELIHTGKKPFSCTFCKYRSRQNAHLKSHVQRKHTIMQNL